MGCAQSPFWCAQRALRNNRKASSKSCIILCTEYYRIPVMFFTARCVVFSTYTHTYMLFSSHLQRAQASTRGHISCTSYYIPVTCQMHYDRPCHLQTSVTLSLFGCTPYLCGNPASRYIAKLAPVRWSLLRVLKTLDKYA